MAQHFTTVTTENTQVLLLQVSAVCQADEVGKWAPVSLLYILELKTLHTLIGTF